MRILGFVLSSLGLVACVPTAAAPTDQVSDFDRGVAVFDAVRAYDHVITQVDFGPRVPGSPAHERTAEWIAVQLTGSGWTVEFQPFEYGGYQLRNIIARDMTSSSSAAPIILGAHYDTRFYADYDDAAPDQPVPGANDGASGVAVLLELARVLETGALSQPVWLVFFDAEDNGRIQGWDWILGSRHFVDVLDVSPSLAVIVDMVGDTDLQIYYEKNSDPFLREEIWAVAASLGFEQFIPEEKYSILDDHTPFLQAGIPAVDIIDFEYPYFHTTEDLPDKVSPESLGAVGRTIEVWLEQNY
ncbi:MAG: M28 family peptidase [Anaerolineales bacterium]|nr:M28 family peptidase [Anaerolineales bacterium]